MNTEPSDREGWLTYHFALIPELLGHMPDCVNPIAAAQLTGMPRAASPEPGAPLRLDPADDAELLWQHLSHFMDLVATRTGERPPYIGGGSIHHWPSWAAPVVTGELVKWLTGCTYRIANDTFFEGYFTQDEHLITVIRQARGKYPIAERQHRAYLPHACPTCLEYAILPEFGEEGLMAVYCLECEQVAT